METRDFKIENRTREQLLGVHIDNRLTFDYLISELCKKASKEEKSQRVLSLIHHSIIVH